MFPIVRATFRVRVAIHRSRYGIGYENAGFLFVSLVNRPLEGFDTLPVVVLQRSYRILRIERWLFIEPRDGESASVE